MKKNKKGAASFYVVAFSTLILVIIAASFATIIISEITRTSNDDLAQSAYDSALAGVEDAKLAYATYEACMITEGGIKSVGGMDCDTVKSLIRNPDGVESCDMVASILGRYVDEGGVKISETKTTGDENVGNNMDQAYTCVKIKTDLLDYRASLSSSNPVKLVPVKLKDGAANSVESINIRWFSTSDAGIINSLNFNGTGVVFPSATLGVAAPPTIGVTLIQTSTEFDLDSFTMTKGKQTNRGTVYLVPTTKDEAGVNENGISYYRAYNKENKSNHIGDDGFLRSNDKTATNKNLPYLVYCNPSSGTNQTEFICNASIDLPEPIDGERSNDTFLFAISLPYGRPATSFLMEFCSGEGGCTKDEKSEDTGSGSDSDSNIIALSGSQIEVDSTGRANDLYKRVAVRLEPYNTSFPYPLYGIQLLDPDEDTSNLLKDLKVTSEHSNFGE